MFEKLIERDQMKKIKFIAFTVLFASLAITSCSNDDSANDNLNENPNNPTVDYWPMAVNNQWTFNKDGELTTETLKITGTDMSGGTTYFKLSDYLLGSELGFNAQTWIAKDGTTYVQKIGDINYTKDGVVVNMNGFQIPVLKSDIAVDGVWNGTVTSSGTFAYGAYSVPGTMTIQYSGTILEKGLTGIVNGITYENVIKCRLNLEITVLGKTIIAETETWYAGGVGPIKISETTDGNTTERILVEKILY